MGGLSIWHWLIVLVVVVLIFGTKKLRNMGADLGGAVKGFKEGMKSARRTPAPAERRPSRRPTIEAEVKKDPGKRLSTTPGAPARRLLRGRSSGPGNRTRYASARTARSCST